MRRVLYAFYALVFLVGCGGIPRVTITTTPPGAEVLVNSISGGASPLLDYPIDFKGKGSVAVQARMEGYELCEHIMTQRDPEFRERRLALTLVKIRE